MKTIILITFLLVSINSRTVYMCHDDPFKDEQCMKKEALGTNTFYWVRKCKGAKVCVDLPYYGGIIGACSIKVRPHYDGESCANGNKCGSGICDGTKCKGLNPDVECIRGLGQCQKGYLCRAATNGYRCQKPIETGQSCSATSASLQSSEHYVYSLSAFNPSYNPCKMEAVCVNVNNAATSTCVKIGSLAKDTKVSNPLACSSGFATEDTTTSGVFICADASDGTTSYGRTAKGASFTKISNITTAFNKWKGEWEKKGFDDDDTNIEAYRYTRNKKKINEYFYQYVYAPFVQDADECAYDYMWKRNSSNSLKFSLIILVLALLF